MLLPVMLLIVATTISLLVNCGTCSENCDYPLSHSYYHRDMCVYLQHDPQKRERSAYAVSHEKAKENCENVGGYIFPL